MIVRHFETEEEYRKHKALNFSKLGSYYHEGIYSPDHALIELEFKSYFEYGKMFETLLQDTVKGTKDFDKRFFISGVSGAIPEKLIQWIDEKEDLESHIVYNKPKKDGSVERSKTHKIMHAFIDECLDNPGMIPVSIEDHEMLKMHVERMCEMPYPGYNVKTGDLLSKAEWQVGIKWKDDYGLEKKALIDAIVDIGGEYILFDIKTAADEKRFSYRLADYYWIQDMQYTEGVQEVIGMLAYDMMQMLFLVAYKDKPYVCQPCMVDYGNTDQRIIAIEEYKDLCESFSKWNGKPIGWLPMKTKKVYLKQRGNI